jgi:hypothetical protein
LFYADEIGRYECHGVYDGKGGVRWTGVHTDVGTDRARIDVVSSDFVDVFDSSPLAKEGRLVKSRGYTATPLTGIRANYPYLHNGSVPTLYDLLGPHEERPQLFNVMAACQFDRRRIGQQVVPAARGGVSTTDRMRQYGDDRDSFNANRPGCDNRGHDVRSLIKTHQRRMALIEYLKTL